MTSSDGYAALVNLGRPVVTTADVARLWRMKLDATSHALARLEHAALVRRIRHGIWKVGPGRSDPRDVLPVLTSPFPSYVSLWSALFHHEMIEQIPTVVYAVSPERPKRVPTADDSFNIQPIHPDLYGGMASPEKALFDTAYLLVPRGGRVTLPELELPAGFNKIELSSWVDRISSARLRSLTRSGVEELCVSGRSAP